ncbi:hypothetical protein V6118_04150, partial [Klebsiella pneumoniae]
KSAQIREILISESAWEEMTCLFAPSLDIAWRLAECEPFRMPTTVSCASCNRAHVFLLTTTLSDIALWLVIRKKSVCGE